MTHPFQQTWYVHAKYFVKTHKFFFWIDILLTKGAVLPNFPAREQTFELIDYPRPKRDVKHTHLCTWLHEEGPTLHQMSSREYFAELRIDISF